MSDDLELDGSFDDESLDWVLSAERGSPHSGTLETEALGTRRARAACRPRAVAGARARRGGC